MALKVGELYALLQLRDDQFRESLSSAKVQLQDLTKNLDVVGASLTASLTLPLVSVGKAAIDAAAEMEQMQIAMTTALGSAERANKFLNDLQEFAAKTPFEFRGLVQSSNQLLAMGFHASEIIPILTSLGNAMAATGRGGDAIQRVILQMGQMRALGKASMEDLRPMAESGIRVFDYLAQHMGTTTREVMEQISKGQIDAATAINAIVQGIARDPRLGNMMEQQSKTFIGKLSNLKDKLYAFLSTAGKPLIDLFGMVVNAVTPAVNALTMLVNVLNALPSPVRNVMVGFGVFVAALGPTLGMIDSLRTSFLALRGILAAVRLQFILTWASALGPLLPVIGAIGLLVSVGYLIVKNWSKVKAGLLSIWNSLRDGFMVVWNAIVWVILKASPVGMIIRGWSVLKSFFLFLWNYVSSAIQSRLEFIRQLFLRYHPKTILLNIWENITIFFENLWARIYDLTVGRIKRIYEQLVDWGKRVVGVFRNIYDRVVGHSYIPDMVNEVTAQFRRLADVVQVISNRMATDVITDYRRMSATVKVRTPVDVYEAIGNIPKGRLSAIRIHLSESFARQYQAEMNRQKAQSLIPLPASESVTVPVTKINTDSQKLDRLIRLAEEQLYYLKALAINNRRVSS